MEELSERPTELGQLAKDVGLLNSAAKLLSAMANERRLRMLILLSNAEMCVGDLTKHIQLDQSPASQHLAKLRAAGLVKTRRNAQQVYYRCDSDKVARILATLEEVDQG